MQNSIATRKQTFTQATSIESLVLDDKIGEINGNIGPIG